ncbi:MAG: LacI family DNA-binding transcriptional regulator [bacterium]
MEKTSKRTTIYDLAKIADASPSAVSSVLNGTWEKRRISQKLAKRVMRLAEEQGYTVNVQASLLRRERSNIIGMIVPKYGNRYFGEIAEQFEAMARGKGFFPVVTCTQRDPELEFEAAKELISYQAECLISTGATDPDRISAICVASGVQSINLDLPGKDAPSVISDNYSAARDLTKLILDRCEKDLDWSGPLRFVGGRLADHNTAARLDGFVSAHNERSISVPDSYIMATGYSAEKAAATLSTFKPDGPTGLFVNSTISLEGVVRWHSELAQGADQIRYGCFDWDPFGSFLPGNVGMVEQDVTTMLIKVFELFGKPSTSTQPILVPCKLRAFHPDV